MADIATLMIVKATVLTGIGPDIILLTTTLPEATWPFRGVASMKIIAARGTGVDYIKQNLKMEPDVICAG